MTIEAKSALCHEFLGYLRKKYPLPRGAKITLTCENRALVRCRGTVGTGLFIYTAVTDTATLHVAMRSRRSVRHTLGTVAHEYKHALQYFRENKQTFGHEEELAAGRFGFKHSTKYCALMGIA